MAHAFKAQYAFCSKPKPCDIWTAQWNRVANPFADFHNIVGLLLVRSEKTVPADSFQNSTGHVCIRQKQSGRLWLLHKPA